MKRKKSWADCDLIHSMNFKKWVRACTDQPQGRVASWSCRVGQSVFVQEHHLVAHVLSAFDTLRKFEVRKVYSVSAVENGSAHLSDTRR